MNSPTLTDEQAMFVKAPIHQHTSLIAAAGSGKSHTLVYRIEHLMDNNIDPANILVIMFNDSAVQNFKGDLDKIDYMLLPEVKTFHGYARGLCNILVEHGYLNKSQLLSDQREYKTFYKNILHLVIPEELAEQYFPKKLVDDFIAFVELIKSSLDSPESVFNQGNYPEKKSFYIDGFYLSEETRHRKSIQFFSDFIYDVINACQSSPECLGLITNRFDAVLVDEFQDANASCYELLKIACGSRAKVNVCGDPNQMIYNFTGATSQFLTDDVFKDFRPVARYYLTRTFRYGHSVALLSNNVIQNNSNNSPLCISARNDLHTKITLMRYNAANEDCEQTAFTDQVRQWIIEGGSFSDIAILLRNYSNSFTFEIACLSKGIPYFISKKQSSVVHSKECDFILNTLIAIDMNDDSDVYTLGAALYSYLTFLLFGIPNKLASLLVAHLRLKQCKEALTALLGFKKQIRKGLYEQLTQRIIAFDFILNLPESTSLKDKFFHLMEKALINVSLSNANRKHSLQAVIRFERLATLLLSQSNDIMGITDKVLFWREEIDSDNVEHKVEITTLHKSKGLSWFFVIVGYLEECVCPAIDAGTDELIEAERRLFYVGITRAKKQLSLHIPDSAIFDESALAFSDHMNPIDLFTPHSPSRFLFESNVLAATTLGYEIYSGLESSSISKSSNRDIFNQYLTELDLPYRLSGLTHEHKQ